MSAIVARGARAAVLSLVVGAAASAPIQARAQVAVEPTAVTPPSLEPEIDPGDGTARKVGRSVTPMAAPVPFKNTQLGWGLMLMGGLFHRFDSDTSVKPSTGMLGGFYTQNGSWGVMAMENARLAGDRWRLRGLYMHGAIRYDFYGVGQEAGNAGQSIGVQQDMDLFSGAALRRVARGVYLGATGTWMRASIAVRDTAGLATPPGVALTDTARTTLAAWGLQGEVDTRNDDYWPVRGMLGRLKTNFFSDALGSSRTFQRYLLSWAWYMPVQPDRLTLATNVNVCGVHGGAPLWALCTVGAGRGGLRGYSQGRYRDSVMTTAQTELRYHSSGRFGAAVFGGFGQIAPTAADVFSADLLWAGGLGARYQLTEKYPMHFRVDYSWGRDGGLFYFGVGEAF